MRRGQAEMVEWFPRLIMLLIAVVVIALLVRYFVDRDVPDEDVSRTSYLYRLYYDGNLITYNDPETRRAYPGVIEYQRFTNDTLRQLGNSSKISSMLTLDGACISKTSIYHDKDTYEQFLGFARFGTLGPGSATIQEELFPVTIKTETTSCPGLLNITIVRPNS